MIYLVLVLLLLILLGLPVLLCVALKDLIFFSTSLYASNLKVKYIQEADEGLVSSFDPYFAKIFVKVLQKASLQRDTADAIEIIKTLRNKLNVERKIFELLFDIGSNRFNNNSKSKLQRKTLTFNKKRNNSKISSMLEESKSTNRKVVPDISQVESEILETFVKGRASNKQLHRQDSLDMCDNKPLAPKSIDPLYTINQFNIFKRFILLNSIDVKNEFSQAKRYSMSTVYSNILSNLPTVMEIKGDKIINLKLVLSIFREEMEKTEFYHRFHSKKVDIHIKTIPDDLMEKLKEYPNISLNDFRSIFLALLSSFRQQSNNSDSKDNPLIDITRSSKRLDMLKLRNNFRHIREFVSQI